MNAGKKKTILVVDDVPENIAILVEILKEEYQIKAATGGEAALTIARADPPPDLILLDVMMPGMDGFEVCRSLKEDGAGASIPVIFLTSKNNAAAETLGFQVGAVDYLTKPVNSDTVLTRVKAHLDQKEEALRLSEIKYRRLFETAKDGILIIDAETGRIIDVNPSLIAMLGFSQETFLGAKIWELGSLKEIAADKVRLLHLQRQEFVRPRRVPLETGDGRRINVEFISSVYPVNHRSVIQINMRDITEQVATERQREELSDRLHHYIATSPAVTYSFRIESGRTVWQWVSENISRILGYTPEEALEPDWWLGHVHPEDRYKVISGIAELISKNALTREYRFTTKDRQSIWLRDEMRLLHASTETDYEVVGTLTDITESKRSEAETSLKSAALEAAGNAIVITDRGGTIEWVNTAFQTLTGYSKKEAIGRNPRDLIRSDKQDPEMYAQLWDTLASGESWHGELVNRKKSGELYDEEMLITPVVDESGRIAHFIAVKNDITEKKRSRNQLEASLHEKEVLLREIHHRVKNNMQIVTSLLSLSSDYNMDSIMQSLMVELHRRIEAMSIVHEQFYDSTDVSRIDFSVSVRQITNNLFEEYQIPPGMIEFSMQASDLKLDLESAIPAGIIVSELISNALKALMASTNDKKSLHVLIHMAPSGQAIIKIHDNGPGLPGGFDSKTARTLGMRLIDILSDQLHGAVTFNSEDGTSATLVFKHIQE